MNDSLHDPGDVRPPESAGRRASSRWTRRAITIALIVGLAWWTQIESRPGPDRTAGTAGADRVGQPGASDDAFADTSAPYFSNADRSSNSPGRNGAPSGRAGAESAAKSPPAAERQDPPSELLYGILRPVADEVYVSAAGLLFTPGGEEGHRIEHLRRHVRDDPGRPGSHGVFDGGIEGALETVDRAYGLAKQGQRTTTRHDKDRTVYTVDLGKRIGFVGGRNGRQRGHPMARRVRLVVEGNRLITAYPL